MRKIPTLFVRDPDDRKHVLEDVTPGCEWVLAGEGVATRKFDGTCVMLDLDGIWWARREVKAGKEPPPFFKPEQTDDVTCKTVGWEPAVNSGFVKFLDEALEGHPDYGVGTYELCGPRINGNPEGFDRHVLIRHATADVLDVNREYDDLSFFLRHRDFEGVVWHHPDGRMAKIKRRDFS